MNELIATTTHLPVTAKALNQFIIIGKERLNAQKAKIRAIEKTGMAIEAKEAALEDAQDMADILLDAEVKLGEILSEIPVKPIPDSSLRGTFGGSEKSLPSDISKKASHQAQTLSQNRDIVEQVKAKARETGEIPTASQVYQTIKNPHVFHNSGENEWYTPPEYIEAVYKVMGGIDIDPASSKIANETVNAKNYYTIEDNGLKNIWFGRVFLNPPYAQPLIAKFCQKLISGILLGDIYEAIVLVNNATETTWFQLLLSKVNAICFPQGRIRFLDPQGKPGSPLQGQIILYYGENPDKFLNTFQQFGWVGTPYGE